MKKERLPSKDLKYGRRYMNRRVPSDNLFTIS